MIILLSGWAEPIDGADYYPHFFYIKEQPPLTIANFDEEHVKNVVIRTIRVVNFEFCLEFRRAPEFQLYVRNAPGRKNFDAIVSKFEAEELVFAPNGGAQDLLPHLLQLANLKLYKVKT